MSQGEKSELNFESAEIASSGDCVMLNGEGGAKSEWKKIFWSSEFSRCLRRNVPAGIASIGENRNGVRFRLTINAQETFDRVDIESVSYYERLSEAVSAAERFTWETIKQGGYQWFQTSSRDDYKVWQAALGDGDRASVILSSGDFHMKREISPRASEWYEITAFRKDYDTGNLSIKSFAEAAAIAITLPTYLSVLGSRQ